MKYFNTKTITLMLSTVTLLTLMGCGGSGGNPSDEQLVGGGEQPPAAAALVIPICTNDKGSEPWRTNGTAEGSFLLKDINEGERGSVSRKMGGNGHNNKFVVMGSETFFPARIWHEAPQPVSDDGDEIERYYTIALYKSDGTTEGTVMLHDFNNSFEGDRPNEHEGLAQLVVMGGNLYFRGWDYEFGSQIWKSNGTPEGTVRVTEFSYESGVASWYTHQIGGLRALENVVTFHARNMENHEDNYINNGGDRYLFKTDGTWTGTEQLTINENGSYPQSMKVVNGKLYFSAMTNEDREPWISNGTKAGTKIIKDINPIVSSNPYGFTGYNGYVYFGAEGNWTTGRELWRTDGTEAGTTLVKDINEEGSSYPKAFKVYKGELYFSISTKKEEDPYSSAITEDEDNKELWKTDGSEAGTVQVYDTAWSSLNPILVVNDKLIFKAGQYLNGMEESGGTLYTLYAYDGSVGEDGNATAPVELINGYILGNFKAVDRSGNKVNDTLLFMSNDREEEATESLVEPYMSPYTALYGTDGTPGDGVVKLKGELCPPKNDG